MASRYEDRRNPRGWDRDDDERRGGANRGSGRNYGDDRSNFGGREADYGRGGYSGSGQDFGQDRGGSQRGGGRSQGSWTGQDREDYGRGGYEGGGYRDEGRNRGDLADDLSGGGMFGGGMGGYSGGGYQGYTGGMSNYGGANYGGGRENYGRDQDRGDRYRSDYPSTERGYMTDRERGGGGRGQDDRGWFERASDEVSSWFGDDDAERRRDHDYRQTGQHRGRGPKNYTRSDDRIREDINDRLTDHHHLDASDIDVEVSGGEVVLTGTVDSRNAKRLAEDIAEEVSGVRNVENRIRVGQGNYGQTANWGSTATATDPGASAGTSGGLTGSFGDTESTTGTTTGATGGSTGTTGSTGTSGRGRGKAA